jgi:EmrB/QacA subfamily drug resistance transporter
MANETTVTGSGKWWAMLAVGLGVLMATLDFSVVNISLPTLVRQLHTDFPTIQWVVLAYVLVVTSLILSVARLGDIFGMKKLYLGGFVIFTIGSLLCGLAPGVGWLIGFRALQGAGAVLMQALGVAIITQVFPSHERGRAMGVIGSVVSTGLALGPALGGVIIGLVGWRWVFLVNVPVGLLAFFTGVKHIPSDFHGSTGQRFDPAGAVILFCTLICYALGMTLGQRQGFDRPLVLLLLGCAAAGLVIFVVIESRVGHPMVDLKLFKNVLFGVNLVMGLLVFIVLAGTFVMPFFLQLVKGYSTEKVGLLMMVVPLTMGAVSPLAGILSDRYGSRGISLGGLLILAGGCLSISTLTAETSAWGFVLRMLPFGLGLGAFQSPNNSAIMGAAPRERLAVASGLLALSRTLGHTSGLPLVGAVFSALVMSASGFSGAQITSAPPEALVVAMAGTYRLAAMVILASSVLAAGALWKSRQRPRNTSE